MWSTGQAPLCLEKPGALLRCPLEPHALRSPRWAGLLQHHRTKTPENSEACPRAIAADAGPVGRTQPGNQLPETGAPLGCPPVWQRPQAHSQPFLGLQDSFLLISFCIEAEIHMQESPPELCGPRSDPLGPVPGPPGLDPAPGPRVWLIPAHAGHPTSNPHKSLPRWTCQAALALSESRGPSRGSWEKGSFVAAPCTPGSGSTVVSDALSASASGPHPRGGLAFGAPTLLCEVPRGCCRGPRDLGQWERGGTGC